MSDELPQSWVWAKMLDILDYEGGSQPPKKEFIYEPREGYVRLMQIRDFGDKPFPTYVPDNKRLKKATREDLLLARYGGSTGSDSLGRICTGLDGAYNVALAKLIFSRDVLEKGYVRYLFLGPWFREKVSQNSRSCQTGFNREDVEDIEFPIAPLAEQRRIVAKLETLLGKVDACQQRLAKIPVLLKRFRQSVLAAACSGRLTADWREENPTAANYSITLELIRKRREAEAKTAAQKEKLREIFSVVEENDTDELPEGWGFAALNKLCSSFDYGTSTKSQTAGKIPVLRMGNIQSGEIDWSDLVFTSDNEEITDYALQPNTVLFNRTNSPELVGKTAIYRGERPAIFAGYLIRINPLPELDPEYLNHCLNTNYAKEFCLRVRTDGVSQSNINAQKIGSFELPLPPLSEQQEIVRRVGALFALADQIEARFQKAQTQVHKLTPSILARAFRGELVEQNPAEEPASELLKRLKLRKV
jgi:type I restriction enzyme S subunit